MSEKGKSTIVLCGMENTTKKTLKAYKKGEKSMLLRAIVGIQQVMLKSVDESNSLETELYDLLAEMEIACSDYDNEILIKKKQNEL